MFKVTGMSVFVRRKLSIKQSSTTQLTATAENHLTQKDNSRLPPFDIKSKINLLRHHVVSRVCE